MVDLGDLVCHWRAIQDMTQSEKISCGEIFHRCHKCLEMSKKYSAWDGHVNAFCAYFVFSFQSSLRSCNPTPHMHTQLVRNSSLKSWIRGVQVKPNGQINYNSNYYTLHTYNYSNYVDTCTTQALRFYRLAFNWKGEYSSTFGLQAD